MTFKFPYIVIMKHYSSDLEKYLKTGKLSWKFIHICILGSILFQVGFQKGFKNP